MAATHTLNPHDAVSMASRRAPLATMPNVAVNSPFRTSQAIAGKRTRAQLGENVYGQPPTKKQLLDANNEGGENVDPLKRSGATVISNEKLDEPFSTKRTSTAPPTAFERKLASVREKKPTQQPLQHQQQLQRADRSQTIKGDNLENVRQWQRHYRRQFPQFVFYFDSVPDDVRQKAIRQVRSLGAREEKFFSNAVTHVVTTRQIPSENTNTSPEDDQAASKRDDAQGRATQAGVLSHDQRKTTSLLDASLQRRVQTHGGHVALDAESRRGQGHAADILTKARELGIKIWALEKLQRVLSTMLQADTGEQGATQDARPTTATRAAAKPAKADLEQLLRNEKINGPADRDMTVAAQDMVTFRGCYIYVHDMDERTKPVMARDYNKPQTKEQGKWPQFRLTGPGRCPFIEDPGHTKRLIEQERKAADDKAQQEIAATRRTRASVAMEENPRDLRRSPRKLAHPNDTAKPLDPPKVIPAKRPHDQSTAHASTEDVQMPPLFGSAQVSRRGMPRMVGGEPVASGLQHSNVTSAIRSQIVSSNISSTAPGFNRRIPDSKEVSALKRKVLERGASNNINSAQSVPSSFMNDMRAAINDDQQGPPPRAAKRRAQETLGVVHEGNENGAADPKRRKAAPRKKSEKEPKPGYCENCRDKFDDFDSHIQSRKHRKFAITQDNWTELDALLVQLKRPHKEH